MMQNIILIIAMSLLSSCAYRAGGLSKEQPYWIPVWMRHSWVRDWLCPLFCLLPLFLHHPSWLFLPAYGLMGVAFTTYWDKVFKFDNFWFSGFMVGLAALPLVFCGFAWWLLLIRAVVLALWWGFWSDVIGNDHAEEHGRGFLVGISSFIA